MATPKKQQGNYLSSLHSLLSSKERSTIAIYIKPCDGKYKIRKAYNLKLAVAGCNLQLAPFKLSIKIPILQRKFVRLPTKEYPV